MEVGLPLLLGPLLGEIVKDGGTGCENLIVAPREPWLADGNKPVIYFKLRRIFRLWQYTPGQLLAQLSLSLSLLVTMTLFHQELKLLLSVLLHIITSIHFQRELCRA